MVSTVDMVSIVSILIDRILNVVSIVSICIDGLVSIVSVVSIKYHSKNIKKMIFYIFYDAALLTPDAGKLL